MGALYEDVEKFFGDIFAVYGRFLARYPVVFILLSAVTSCLLGMGMLSIQYETHVDKLYTPMGSQAFKDQASLHELFPERTSSAFYDHQQLYLDTYGSVLIGPYSTVPGGGEAAARPVPEAAARPVPEAGPPSGNVLTSAVLADVHDLHKQILAITLDADHQGFRYADLCASRDGACVIDGSVLLGALIRNSCLSLNDSYPLLSEEAATGGGGGSGSGITGGSRGRGRQEDLRSVLAEMGEDEAGCMTAQAFRIRYNLRHDTAHQRELGLLWEILFLDHVAAYNSAHVHVSYSTSESLDIELTEHAGEDTKFFALTITIMIVYATFVSTGGNWVSTRVLLAQAGVVAALLAILASFGLLSMCGMTFVDICGVMPFLVLGVGVDDMFILMSGWRQTDVTKNVEERISETLRSSAISVTITSLTDLLAFCIGATSPFLSVKTFCIYTGVAVFLCYINQLTFFGGCLVLHARRVEASQHCLTCRGTSSRRTLEAGGKSRGYVFCCSGQPSSKVGEDDSLCEKIPSSFMPRMLLKTPTKTVIIIGFIVYISVSMWGASQIKTGLKLERVVPESSYLYEFIVTEGEFFPNRGAYIMFAAMQPLNYADPGVHIELRNVFKKAMDSNFLDPTYRISWLESYMSYWKNQPYANVDDDFVRVLREKFLPLHKEFENDVLFSDDKTEIVASRVYVKSMLFHDSTEEGDLMIRMRDIAKNSTLPLTAYGPEFIYYEHYVSVLKNTLLAVGVATIGMLFVALMFIPHPISITCVTFTMATIVLGMFGFMHFWGLALSAITTVQIILSVGFCVDFTVHISHAFMTATGKNRNERVMAALEKVGVPILNGAVSSILGILMLAFTSSYVFRSFFKTMLLVIVLGVAHSLLFLPVMLSFVGPRRTSKPRVFIPISVPVCKPSRALSDVMSEYARGVRIQLPPEIEPRAAAGATTAAAAVGAMATATATVAAAEVSECGEHIELLQVQENSAPAILHMEDIDLGTDGREQSSSVESRSGDDYSHPHHQPHHHQQYYQAPQEDSSSSGGGGGEPRATTLPRAQRVRLERPPEEEIRLSHLIGRADRTPSPLLSKPHVDKPDSYGSRDLLERLGAFGQRFKDEDKRKDVKGKGNRRGESSSEERDKP